MQYTVDLSVGKNIVSSITLEAIDKKSAEKKALLMVKTKVQNAGPKNNS